MAPRLSHQGFSFDRPPNRHWYIPRDQEQYTDVTLRRETGSKTHSFYARIDLAGMERQPVSHEDFAAMLAAGGHREQGVTYEVVEVSREQKMTTIQSQWCVRIDTLKNVRGAPVAPDSQLQMTIRGFQCVHPAFPKTMIELFYSERGLPSEIDPALAEEGEEFLRGVRIDVAPDTPASASSQPIGTQER